VNACFCCVGFIFFHTKPRDWLGKRLRNDPFCVEWDVKPQLNQSVNPWKGAGGVLGGECPVTSATTAAVLSPTRLRFAKRNRISETSIVHRRCTGRSSRSCWRGAKGGWRLCPQRRAGAEPPPPAVGLGRSPPEAGDLTAVCCDDTLL